ncbi:AAA family ATPase [Pectobacterium brasiliense]|uniref:AAA family ATPase n=1 Tax=Pectobacterium brasiliense TaxID=180957 RepID=UPI001F075D54|nr:AAA family ATPase [Pectobacterium brasiliense]
MLEQLSNHFEVAIAKYLSAVDVNIKKSNQHEIGGLVKAGFSKYLPTPQNGEKISIPATLIYIPDENSEPISCKDELTWYDTRYNKENRPPEYRMYYKTNTVSSMMNEGDFFLIIKNDANDLFFIITPTKSLVETRLKELFGINNVGDNFSQPALVSPQKDKNDIKVKTTNQNIDSIYFKNLKCLQDVTIHFTSKKVTAIFGPNGSGKSTILHAMASLYQPEDKGENYRFIDFFPRSPDAEWNGSHLEITHSYRKGKDEFHNESDFYGKSEQKGSRWIKIYARRPFREVYYIGIGQCVPMIESEKNNNNINYITTSLKGEHANILLHKASDILNKRYSSINQHELQNGKTFIGVETNGVKYSALSMSAGEQKVFFILDKVFSAGKNALILIDEIDLLLHDKALKRLIEIIAERADDKNIQVVFTTHRESLLSLSDIINIRHIVSMDGKTLCFNETKPDAINRLTGKSEKNIEIFVEDDFSYFIIQHLCSDLKAMRHVAINIFGAASNAFTVIAGLLLKGDECSNVLLVLDGDEYKTEQSKKDAINKVLTGTDERVKKLRNIAHTKIKQFNLPDKMQPEKFIHELLCDLPNEAINPHDEEIVEIAKQINYVGDQHRYVYDIIERLGIDHSSGYSKVISLAAKHQRWKNYIDDVNKWIINQVDIVKEN